jgi:tetratricopeptide (TPR) repeat protein
MISLRNSFLSKLSLPFWVVVLLLNNVKLAAQNKSIDSLQAIISKDKADTTKVNHMIALCSELEKEGAHEQALILLSDGLKLANSLTVEGKRGWLKGMGEIYFLEAGVYSNQYDYAEALKSYFTSLEIKQQLKEDAGIAKIHQRIGSIYYQQNKYDEALREFYLTLNLYQNLNNKFGVASCYNSIGSVYFYLTNYSEAESNYYAALQLADELKDKTLLAQGYNNIGMISYYRKEYEKSLADFKKALALQKETKNKRGIASSYNNIGQIVLVLGNEAEAEENYLMTLSIAEEIGDKQLIATAYHNIGTIYVGQKRYAEARENFNAAIKIRVQIKDRYGESAAYVNIATIETEFRLIAEAENHLKQALTISTEIGALDILMASYQQLAIIDSIKGNWKQAFHDNQLYIVYKDSIYNEETRKKGMQNSLSYEFKKKQDEIKKDQLIKDARAEEARKRQGLVLTLVTIVLVLAIVGAVLLLRTLRVTNKQKVVIEEKNKDIIDSINYAKRIQDALLKEKDHVSDYLPEHFVFFKPKDIVSGDFYWSIEKQGYWYLAAADCTGHGVPGAFMSMLGIAFLNEITASNEVLSPAEILDQLRDKIVKELDQNENDTQNRDGLDISLVRFHKETKELQWAGANNPLYIIKNNELREIKPNKQPIGFHVTMQSFTNHTLYLQAGTGFYLFTDGYADQFGGEKGKKFMYKKLKDLLISTQAKTVEEQKDILVQIYNDWKGELEQIDDVCIIGIRV